jgi:hypothetical protein
VSVILVAGVGIGYLVNILFLRKKSSKSDWW